MRHDVAGRRREPVSFEQERVWVEEHLAPGQRPSAAVVAIDGPLVTAALAAAVTSLAARHPSLRTTFGAVDGVPVAVIGDTPQTSLEITAAGAGAATAPDARADAMAAAREPLPLGEGPLLRASLIRQDDDHHVLVLAAHRMIADEPSLGIMLTELGPLYAAHLPPGQAGGAGALPAPPAQTCAGYAVWQRDMASRGGFEADLRYWRGYLAGAPSLRLPHPAGQPPDPVPAARRTVTRQARPGTLRRAREFAAARGVAPRDVITAACHAVFAHYASEDDVVTGCALSNRGQPGLDSLIGQFTNVLPLRVSLAADPAFGELTGRVAAAMTGVCEHGHVPFQAVAAALCPPRDIGRYPFFEVATDVAAGCANPAAVPSPPDLPGLTAGLLEVTAPALAAGLGVGARVTGDELELTTEYPEGCYGSDWALALLASIDTALNEGMAAPGERISALPLLAGHERAAVTSASGPQRPYPVVTLHELVWRQAARTPHAPAVTWQRGQATYAQLHQVAESVAASLRAAGAESGTAVGVLLPPGFDLIAGILGVLSAGSVYVQLDPGEPVQRLAQRCAQAGLSIAVTTQALRTSLPEAVTAVMKWDGTSAPRRGARAAGLPSRGAGTDAPCALLFTNGQPAAAVTVSHRNVVAAVSGLLHALGAERFRGSVFTTAASCADGLAQLWPPLVTGGAVVVTDGPPAAVGAVMPDGATIMTATPEELTRSLRSAPLPPAVRTLIVGGGYLPEGLTRDIFGHSSVNDIYACYGCAETTTYVITRWAARGREQQAGYARPLGNVTALVLDRYGNPVPPGVAGELCLGGPAVASAGYLGQPDLTQRRFVRVTVAGTAQPVYRTGEPCRILAGGELELLGGQGQADSQPSGDTRTRQPASPAQRELAQIWCSLLKRDAVPPDGNFFQLGGTSLLAVRMLSLAGERFGAHLPPGLAWTAPTLSALASQIAERTAAGGPGEPVTVPGAGAVAPEKGPATPSGAGETGETAPPGQPASPQQAGGQFVAPRTGTEHVIAEIYASVLGVPRVGALDDFFDLGGGSLEATAALGRIRQRLAVSIPMADFMGAATVEAAAQAVDGTLLGQVTADDLAAAVGLAPGLAAPTEAHDHG